MYSTTHNPVVQQVVLSSALEVGIEYNVTVTHEELSKLILWYWHQVEVLDSG